MAASSWINTPALLRKHPRAGRTAWARRIGTVALFAAIGHLQPAPPAQADDDGWVRNGYLAEADYNYLTKLRSSGVAIPLPTGALIQNGHIICDRLRRGVGPTEEAERYFPTVGIPAMLAAAQSELCPDTLG